jgi:hypothetical protein
MGEIEVIRTDDRVRVTHLEERAHELSGELVKAVVDVARG